MNSPNIHAFPSTAVLQCGHCGNLTPHSLQASHTHRRFYDQIEIAQYETYTWLTYICGTCQGLNLYGAFFGIDTKPDSFYTARIHPVGAEILPLPHTVSPSQPVPEHILRLYEEVWPLRHRAPAAFIGQIRRTLEYVCVHQNAVGKDLFKKLQDLGAKGILPGYFAQITDLLREVGNMGAHATSEELSVWDAELIDEFFRALVNYVYIAPARIKRMQERLSARNQPSADEP